MPKQFATDTPLELDGKTVRAPAGFLWLLRDPGQESATIEVSGSGLDESGVRKFRGKQSARRFYEQALETWGKVSAEQSEAWRSGVKTLRARLNARKRTTRGGGRPRTISPETESQILARPDAPAKQLAEEFGVTPWLVSAVRRRR